MVISRVYLVIDYYYCTVNFEQNHLFSLLKTNNHTHVERVSNEMPLKTGKNVYIESYLTEAWF